MMMVDHNPQKSIFMSRDFSCAQARIVVIIATKNKVEFFIIELEV